MIVPESGLTDEEMQLIRAIRARWIAYESSWNPVRLDNEPYEPQSRGMWQIIPGDYTHSDS